MDPSHPQKLINQMMDTLPLPEPSFPSPQKPHVKIKYKLETTLMQNYDLCCLLLFQRVYTESPYH